MVQHQIDKAIALKTNKEVGAVKRSITHAANKAKKTEERNRLVWTKYEAIEEKLRQERERKMNALFGQGIQGAPELQEKSTYTQKEPTSKSVCVVSPLPLFQVQLDQILHEAMNTELPEDAEFPENTQAPTAMDTREDNDTL